MSLLTAELKRLQTKQGVKFRSGFLNLGAKKVMNAQTFTLMRNPESIWKLDGLIYASQVEKWLQIF